VDDCDETVLRAAFRPPLVITIRERKRGRV
jgi:hypothetical protein